MKKLIVLALTAVFAVSLVGCGTTAESSSNTDIKAETSEMVTTEVAKYSNVAINSAKKAIQYMQSYVDGTLTAEEAEAKLDEIENDLGDYILKNENLPTTDNDRWISGEIDLAKYSLGTDKVASVTEHMDELKSMIE